MPATASSSREAAVEAAGDPADAAADSSIPGTSTTSSNVHTEGSHDPKQAAPVLKSTVPEEAIEGPADRPDGRLPAADSIATGGQQAGPSRFHPDALHSHDQSDGGPMHHAQEQHSSAQLDEGVHQAGRGSLLQPEASSSHVQALHVANGAGLAGEIPAGRVQQGEGSPTDASTSHPGASSQGPSPDQELAGDVQTDMPEASDADILEDELQEGMEGEEPDQEEAQEGPDADLLEPMTDDSDQQMVISSHEPGFQEVDAEVDIST